MQRKPNPNKGHIAFPLVLLVTSKALSGVIYLFTYRVMMLLVVKANYLKYEGKKPISYIGPTNISHKVTAKSV